MAKGKKKVIKRLRTINNQDKKVATKKSLKKQKAQKGDVEVGKMSKRSFSPMKRKAARLEYKLATGYYPDTENEDLAAPHRAPYASLRDRILVRPLKAVKVSVLHLAQGSLIYETALAKVQDDPDSEDYHKLGSYYEKTRKTMLKKLNDLANDPTSITKRKSLVKAVNNLASNAPGYGPHNTTNNPVSNRLHLAKGIKVSADPNEFVEPLTPRSGAGRASLPGIKVATTNKKSLMVNPSGEVTPADNSISMDDREDVNVGNVIVRGSLAVKKGSIYRPTGKKGWERVA